MAVLFEVLKWVFFFLSILVGAFFLRGDYILSDSNFQLYGDILMPGYIVIVWIMIGYIIATIWIVKDDLQENEEQKNKVYTKSFAIWTVLGVLLAVLYVFL